MSNGRGLKAMLVFMAMKIRKRMINQLQNKSALLLAVCFPVGKKFRFFCRKMKKENREQRD